MDLSTGKKYAKKMPPIPGQRVFKTKDMEEAGKKQAEEQKQEPEQKQQLRHGNDRSVVRKSNELVIVPEKK